MSKKREYDEEYKEQAVRLAKKLGSAKAAAEELHLPHLSFLQALLPAPCTHFHIVYFLTSLFPPFFLFLFYSFEVKVSSFIILHQAEFLARKAKHHEEQYSVDTKKLTEGRFRLQELDTLIQNIYEDKVLGKVSEDVAMKLIAKYEAEQKELSTEVASLEEKFTTIRQDEEDVALFMERLRKYTDVQELTREMCLKLIEYITLDAYVEGQPREIYINYKLLDEPLKDKRSLF